MKEKKYLVFLSSVGLFDVLRDSIDVNEVKQPMDLACKFDYRIFYEKRHVFKKYLDDIFEGMQAFASSEMIYEMKKMISQVNQGLTKVDAKDSESEVIDLSFSQERMKIKHCR